MSLSVLYLSLLSLILPLSGTEPMPLQKNPVTIGLLVSDSSFTYAINAAKEAINEANLRGGFDGLPFKLVVRFTEGPWGKGSKESVGLVYEDQVRAIVGHLDGRNAHLAEQVAAKSHLVYLETRASDPTLSQAYVPWFIRNVPNDDQQAEAILDLIGKEGVSQMALLSSEAYENSFAIKSLTKVSSERYGVAPQIIHLGANKPEMEAAIKKAVETATGHLVVPILTEASLGIISRLREQIPHLRIYGTLAFTRSLDDKIRAMKSLEGIVLVHSYKGSKENSLSDSEELAASYVVDGINMILQAINEVGLNQEAIRDYLLDQKFLKGLTGPVIFDEMGNRKGQIQFTKILNGKPVPVD